MNKIFFCYCFRFRINMSDSDSEDETQSAKVKYRKSQSKIIKVICGEEGCVSKPMLLQNLKEHAKIKHGTNHPKIKGQPTVSSMFLGVGKIRERKVPKLMLLLLQVTSKAF